MSDVEAQIAAAMADSVDESQESLRRSGQNLISQLYSSTAGLTWATSFYPNMKLNTTRALAFGIIKHWYSLKWYDFVNDVELIDDIKDLLFDSAMQDFSVLDSLTRLELGKAQAQFILHSDINVSLQLIIEICTSNTKAALYTTSALSELMILPTPNFIDQFMEIRSAFLLNQVTDKFLDVAIEGITQNDPMGLKLLKFLIRWDDPNHLFNSDSIFNIILPCFSEESMCESAIECFESLVIRDKGDGGCMVSSDYLSSIINNLGSSYPLASSNLFKTYLTYNNRYLDDSDVFPFVDFLLENASEDSLCPVMSLFSIYLFKQPENRYALFQKVYLKLREYLHSFQEISLGKNVFYITEAQKNLLINDNEAKVALLSEIYRQDFVYPSDVTAFILVILNSSASVVTSPAVVEMLTKFEDFLQYQPPYDPQLFVTLYTIYKLPIGVSNLKILSLDSQYKYFSSILSNYVSQAVTEEQRNKLYELLDKYIILIVKNLDIPETQLYEVINMLTSMFTSSSLRCVALLFQTQLPDRTHGMIATVLNAVSDMVEARGRDRTSLITAGRFIADINVPIYGENITKVMSMVEDYATVFPYDTEVYSAMLSSLKVLKSQGIAMFKQMMGYLASNYGGIIPDMQTLLSVSSALYVVLDSLPKGEEYVVTSPEFQMYLKLITSEFGRHMDTAYTAKLPAKTLQTSVFPMVVAVYGAVGGWIDVLDQDTKLEIIEISAQLLVRHYDCPNILITIFRFLSILFEETQYDTPLMQRILPLTFNMLYCPSFEPATARWGSVIGTFVALMSSCNKKRHQVVSPIVSDILRRFEDSDEIVNQFLFNLEGDVKVGTTSMMQLFTHVTEVRNRRF